MRTGTRATLWSAGLAAILFAAVVGCTTVGAVSLDPVGVAKAILDALPGLSFDVESTTRTIVVDLRLPRILLAAVVGFALGAAGTVMQGFFRNPMADPSIIGVSTGAAVGAVAVIAVPAVAPPALVLLGFEVASGLQIAAFATALVTAFGVYLIASDGGRTPVATLLLAGVAVQTFLGAVISYLMINAGRSLERAVYWMMGHLHASTYHDVIFAGLTVAVGFPILLAFASDLNVLLLGEEDAHHLGVSVERTKGILLAVSTLVTAAAVAVSGVIGFVGLIVPHMMRLVVGPDHRILLPTSALAGASFLVLTDTLARARVEQMPVGIVTAALGAPFFLFLLRRREVTEL
ncbi:MAG TPA: vitamin B12 ABC transporter permease BtuC [Natrialbaceae archaeon]|nr:vitamin B12 ABC transporter permease BtuC [Natrialbaceae archaeon]